MSTVHKRFGFDLDNTLIDYSNAVKEYSKKKNLSTCSNIKSLKEMLYKDNDFNYEWQLAQGWLYTEGLKFAELGIGSYDLCYYLTSKEYQLYIVSHKTSNTPDFCGNQPLHDVATKWVKNSEVSHFFAEPNRIYYEATRRLKVKRIEELELNYFVDDLEEVFLEPQFPKNTKKFHIYGTQTQKSDIKAVLSFSNIKEIISNEY